MINQPVTTRPDYNSNKENKMRPIWDFQKKFTQSITVGEKERDGDNEATNYDKTAKNAKYGTPNSSN